MSSELSASAQKVQDALLSHGFTCQVLELADSTRTAMDAAAAVGCQVGQIVKSLLFRGKQTKKPIFVAVSGANRVNEKALRDLVGEKIEKADADFVREKTGFAIGGVPPLAHLEPILAFVDEDLMQYEEIWAAAGTPNALFKLTPDELVLLTKGQVISVK
jgi:prolyl-tRNA editing enzyme YbaK/EbsC (Cys-tRNA(Pro) deacylase)